MNKKLIALAVAGAIAPLAAQADVIIYGKMHMSVDWYDNAQVQGSTSNSGVDVSSNFSRIGFKGSEDLGMGLKGIWQVESQVDLSEGTNGTWASRNSFLGVASDFGTVVFGRHDTPFKDLGRKLDIFGDTVGDWRAITAQQQNGFGGAPALGIPGFIGSPGWDVRANNVIAYISPDLVGLKLFVAYSADTGSSGTADNNNNQAFSGSLTYQNGPIFAGVAYESHDFNQVNSSVTFAGIPGVAPITITTNDSTLNEHAWRAGLGLTFGGFKFGGLWQESWEDQLVNPLANKRQVYGVFGQYAFGATSIGAQWAHAGDADNISNSSADLWAVGLFHNLSKRTQVYAMYAKVENDDNSNNAIGGGGGHGDVYAPENSATNPLGLGNSPGAASIGLIHSF